MRGSALTLAFLTAASGLLSGQQGDTTSLTLEGFLQQDRQSGHWTIVVPLPLDVLGTRTFVLAVGGKPGRWEQFLNQYIQASGRASRSRGNGAAGITIDVNDMKKVDPPGTAATTLDRGVGMRAKVSLSVIPNRFAWRDARGNATGVNPLLLYTILNEQVGPIILALPTNDKLCARVQAINSLQEWDSTTPLPRASAARFFVGPNGVYRNGMQLPEAAAPLPGTYRASVGVCEAPDYEMTTQFEVQ
jgi:hypothetical protein